MASKKTPGEQLYGFVIKALETLVEKEYGHSQWITIGRHSNVDGTQMLESNCRKQMKCIIKSACEILNFCVSMSKIDSCAFDLEMERNELIMEKAGSYYFSSYLELGHEVILRRVGRDLPTFISGLNALHDHFNQQFPEMRPPSFQVSFNDETENGFYVKYCSERIGLEHFVVGMIKNAAKVLFKQIVTVNVISFSENINDHALIFVKTSKNECFGRTGISTMQTDLNCDLEDVIDAETFANTFPFHLLLDRQLTVCQAGVALLKIFPQLNTGNTKFNDVFTIIKPIISPNFDDILSQINSIFDVETKKLIPEKLAVSPHSLNVPDILSTGESEPDNTSLRLKGQMIYLKESDTIIFFSSPRILNLDGLSEKGMYLSDIPLHDATRDLILLSEQNTAENQLKKKLEHVTDELQKTSRELEHEQTLADQLLYSILPPSVADDLRHKRPVAAKKYDMVTMMFSGIADFATVCNSCNPMDVVDALNHIYIQFDRVTEENSEIYKVETVGDKYMCVSGLPEKSNRHAHNIAQLAIDLMDIGNGALICEKKLTVTIGIHSGEVVAGVIGQKLPRFCLFGNVVNLTSRTETTGIQGKINITEATYKVLCERPDPKFHIKCRGRVVMKGLKNPMICYFLSKSEP